MSEQETPADHSSFFWRQMKEQSVSNQSSPGEPVLQELDRVRAEVEQLKQAIRQHRDERGHDRCWLDDDRLYRVLGEGPAISGLPAKPEFLGECEKFWESRQAPCQKSSAGDQPAQAIAVALAQYRDLADRAIRQVKDQDLHLRLEDVVGLQYKFVPVELPTHYTNSIAILMRHMAGNLRSRFTGFWTEDGEKPDRQRDQEFLDTEFTRDQLLAEWNSAWGLALEQVRSLRAADFAKTVVVRGHRRGVLVALLDVLAHMAYHTGQITMLARRLVGAGCWEDLTIPVGGSDEFNRSVWGPDRAGVNGV